MLSPVHRRVFLRFVKIFGSILSHIHNVVFPVQRRSEPNIDVYDAQVVRLTPSGLYRI